MPGLQTNFQYHEILNWFWVSAVGNAFAVLSDAEKRKQYDLYGPDEANSHSSHRNTYTHEYSRGYEGKH